MIARTWRGRTRASDAEAYAEYIGGTGMPEYRATPGNRGALMLYRIDGSEAEFMTVSFWDSLDAIRAFAGDEVERARFYPEDDRYLIARDLTADHWTIAEGDAPPSSPARRGE